MKRFDESHQPVSPALSRGPEARAQHSTNSLSLAAVLLPGELSLMKD